MSADAGRPTRPWPKVHLVYFLLAAIDLVVILAGLFLSHQVIRVFERNVEDFAALDRLMASSWALMDTAGDAQRTATDALITGDAALSTMNFKGKLIEVRQEVSRLQRQIDSVLPARAARRANTFMVRIGMATVDMERTALNIVSKVERKDSTGALRDVAALQARYEQLRNAIGDLNQLVTMVKISNVDQSRTAVESWRKYEYLIGGAVAIIVCCVTAYGLWVGRLMKQKYNELEASNVELAAAQADSAAFAVRLQAINDDVTQLNRELAENMRKLSEAQDETARRSRFVELGKLTATVAHELRNPLGSVRTSAYLLSRKLAEKEPSLEPLLARIERGVVRCDKIIGELLDFSRESQPARKALRVDDWIAQVVEEEAARLSENLRFDCNLGLGNREASFDPDRLGRALTNLLQNAAEAMIGQAGAPVAPLVAITSRLTSRGIEIAVADNGPGIAGDVLARIRDPLFSTKHLGVGLGLSVVERIMEQHGGGLDIESSPGAGSCFTIWFPLNPVVRAVA